MYTISNGTERQLMRAGKQFLRNIWSLSCYPYQPQVLNTNLVHHRTATNYYDVLACVPGIPVEKTLYPFA